jgi:hypothetical protein
MNTLKILTAAAALMLVATLPSAAQRATISVPPAFSAMDLYGLCRTSLSVTGNIDDTFACMNFLEQVWIRELNAGQICPAGKPPVTKYGVAMRYATGLFRVAPETLQEPADVAAATVLRAYYPCAKPLPTVAPTEQACSAYADRLAQAQPQEPFAWEHGYGTCTAGRR